MDTEKRSFTAIVDLLKERMLEHDTIITNQEIADKLGISEQRFYQYYANDELPDELFSVFDASYIDVLKGVFIVKVQHSTVVYPPKPPGPKDHDKK